MNFDRATIHYPDGRVAELTPPEFYAISLSERIDLLTKARIKFTKDNHLISPLDALKKR